MIVGQVQRTVDERRLLPNGARVLVGCSGGPDSAALLHVMSRLAPARGWRVHAASVDHGLRADAANDVETAARQAADLGVPFQPLKVTVPSGASRQGRARKARYAALARAAEAVGATYLAVGHTRDDQAETVLARLLRGSGIRGLSGVAPARADGVIRPLIDCARVDVHAYAKRHGLSTCQDPSNDDPRYERVRLRRLLPTLEAESPRLTEHLLALADECRETAAWIEGEAAALALHDATHLDPSGLRGAAPPVRNAALRAWVQALTGKPARRTHIVDLTRALQQRRGEVWLAGGWTVECGETWVARRAPKDCTRGRRRDP